MIFLVYQGTPQCAVGIAVGCHTIGNPDGGRFPLVKYQLDRLKSLISNVNTFYFIEVYMNSLRLNSVLSASQLASEGSRARGESE